MTADTVNTLIFGVVALFAIQVWANYANNVLYVTKRTIFQRRDEDESKEPKRMIHGNFQ